MADSHAPGRLKGDGAAQKGDYGHDGVIAAHGDEPPLLRELRVLLQSFR